MEKRALAVRKHVRLEGCIGDSGVLETGDYCQRQTAERSRRNSRFKEQPSLRNSRVFAFDQRPRQVAGARNERGHAVSVPNFTFLSTSSLDEATIEWLFHLVASTDDFFWQTGVNFFRYEFFFLLFLLEELKESCSGSIIYYNNFCVNFPSLLTVNYSLIFILILFWRLGYISRITMICR